MKKTVSAILLFVLVFAGLTGCKKVLQSIFPGLNIDSPAITFTIPAIPFAPPAEVPVGTFSQHFNLDSIIKVNTNNAFSIQDVTSVKVTQVKFSLSNADQQNNLANFESVRFTMLSSANTQAAEIAAVNFPDVYAESYTYTATNAPELITYLKGNELVYNVYGKLRRITTKPLTLTMILTMKVK
jgi:hypothetical protein